MIDMHYDLLSVAYKCYKLGDYSYLINWSKNYNDNIYIITDNPDYICGLENIKVLEKR